MSDKCGPTGEVPWEDFPTVPWETPSLYGRVISIRRPRTPAVVGGQEQLGLINYSGLEQTTDPGALGEDVLYINIPANIQPKTPGRTKGTLLPGDIIYKPEWTINIPVDVIPQYGIRDRDLVYDDEGYRYAVAQNAYNSLGYNLVCIRLES